MLEPVIWLLLVELIGLTAFIPAFSLFRNLPDRGFSLSKASGLLLLGYFSWLTGMSGLSLSPWLVLILGMGALNGWLLLRNGRKLAFELASWLKQHIKLLLTMQLLFWGAYAFLVTLRVYSPDIFKFEKFTDYAFINSLSLAGKLPAPDLWMSGYPINYYYFGHYLTAMLVKMSRLPLPVAFNLIVPLVFALSALGSFGLGFNLVKAARPETNWKIAAGAGGLTAYMICIMGNLDSVRQLLYAASAGGFKFDWLAPSRVIYDYIYSLNAGWQWIQTINEFPMFSFILGDAHAHVLALPFVLLVIALALNFWLWPEADNSLSLRRAEGWFILIFTALATGALYFLNAWDYPTYTLLLLAAILIGQTKRSGSSKIWAGIRRVGPVVVLSIVFYLPFHLNYTSAQSGNNVEGAVSNVPGVGQLIRLAGIVDWERTPLLSYFLIFGIFVLPVLSFLSLKLYPYFTDPYKVVLGSKKAERSTRFGKSFLGAGAGLIVLGQAGAYLLKWSPLLTILVTALAYPLLILGIDRVNLKVQTAWRKRQARLAPALTALILAGLLVGEGWLLRFELLGLLYVPLVLTGLLLVFERKRARPESWQKIDYFVLLLIFGALALNLGTEFFFIRDVYNDRSNTLFKFYYQTWLMFGLASAYAAWRVAGVLYRNRRKTNLLLWSGGVAVFLALGLIYPALATWERSGRFAQAIGLDGMAWLREGNREGQQFQSDYAAIQWLIRQRQADPKFSGTLLEAALAGDEPGWARISTFSAIPAFVGDVKREQLWRGGQTKASPNNFDCSALLVKYGLSEGNGPKSEPQCRESLTTFIYTTSEAALAEKLLREAGVKFVYVGAKERELYATPSASSKENYSPGSLTKFASFMKVVYQDNGVTIYSF